MHRIHYTFLSILSISVLFFTACPKTNVDVGSIGDDSGSTSQSSQTGGSSLALGGAAGGGGSPLGEGGTGGSSLALGGAAGGGGSSLGEGGAAGASMALGGTASGSGGYGAGGAVTGPNAGGLGAACDLGVVLGPSMGSINTAAADCASGLCLKSVDSVGGVDTGALCTAGCATDSDCDGILRDPGDPSDKRCVSGFTCGVAFVKGSMCCRNLCICKDFTGGPVPLPIACQGTGALTCMQ
jgi:hypothetical protein